MSNRDHRAKTGMGAQPAAELLAAVEEAAVDGRVSCAALREIAEARNIPYKAAGAAADEAGIRISGCELGCF